MSRRTLIACDFCGEESVSDKGLVRLPRPGLSHFDPPGFKHPVPEFDACIPCLKKGLAAMGATLEATPHTIKVEITRTVKRST